MRTSYLFHFRTSHLLYLIRYHHSLMSICVFHGYTCFFTLPPHEKIKTLVFDYAYHTIFSFLHAITDVLYSHITLQWPYSYVKLSTDTIILYIIFQTDMTDSCIFSFLFNLYSKKFHKKLVRISQEDDNWESNDWGFTILHTDCAITLLRFLLIFHVSTYWLLHFLFPLPFYFPWIGNAFYCGFLTQTWSHTFFTTLHHLSFLFLLNGYQSISINVSKFVPIY